jgi:ABC-type transport system involved in cytochrome bd biosynthesis fused ATPase/permease subunit
MPAVPPVRLRATAGVLLGGGLPSLGIIAAVIFVQRLALPLSVLWLGDQGYRTATAALFGAAALSFVRARAADRLSRTVRLNLLELYLAPFERGPAPALPSHEAVTSRLATALPTLVGWAVEGAGVALGAALSVPAVALLLAHALGAPVLIPLGAAGAAGAVVTLAASRRVERAWTVSWERSRVLLSDASDGWAGAVDLRAHGRARAFGDRLRAGAIAWSGAEGRARVLSAVTTWGALGATLSAALGTAALLGQRLAAGGDVYRAFLLVLSAIPALQSLAGAVSVILSSREELENADHQRLLAASAGAGESDDPIDPTAEIRLEGVGYAYPPSGGREGNVALCDVTLILPPGQSVAVVGPNGAGKTTLLHVLLGLIRPDRGRVLVAGREARLDNRRFRERVAFLSQRPFTIAGGTIADNLRAFDPALADDRLIAALAQVGLLAQLRARAGGDAAALGVPLAELSSGQQRRVMLARALLREADLVVLDEPEAHLDSESVEELRAILRAVAREHRVVAVVHDRSLAGFADRVIDLGPPEGDRR